MRDNHALYFLSRTYSSRIVKPPRLHNLEHHQFALSFLSFASRTIDLGSTGTFIIGINELFYRRENWRKINRRRNWTRAINLSIAYSSFVQQLLFLLWFHVSFSPCRIHDFQLLAFLFEIFWHFYLENLQIIFVFF